MLILEMLTVLRVLTVLKVQGAKVLEVLLVQCKVLTPAKVVCTRTQRTFSTLSTLSTSTSSTISTLSTFSTTRFSTPLPSSSTRSRGTAGRR